MGHHNIHFGGDQNALAGAWSPPTSAANFCEEDYAITFLIAEFINSLTNLAYVILALKSMYGPGSGGLLNPKLDFMSISLFGLGVGSFLFHATLRQTFQFVDDLSMIVLAWSMLHSISVARQTPTRARNITYSLGLGAVSFSAFYLQSGKIIYHVIAFASMIALVASRSQYLYHWDRPFTPEKCRSFNVRTWQSIFTCLFGYLLWNIDLEYCAELRRLRHELGLPWSWLLELHGWWHILTAIGASQFMNVAREVHEELKHEKEE